MRKLIAVMLLASAGALAQTGPGSLPNGQPVLKSRNEVPADTQAAAPADRPLWIVPAGTKIPVQLRQAVSTKNAQPGDPLYGQTTFPVVVGDQVMIPAGTFVQGVVDSAKRAGRIKGTAELQFHLTTLLYPNGYALNLLAAVEQVPGDESAHIKEPGTVKHDSEKGKDLERIGRGASQGGAIGSVAGAAIHPTIGGLGAGGLAGIAAGTAIAMLARGSDVRFEVGTVIDVSLNRAIALDPQKVMRASALPAYYPGQQMLTLDPPRPPQR